MKIPLPPRRAWLEGLKNVACAVAVTAAVGAGAVIAASESLQPMPASAIVVLCDALGRCRGAMRPDASASRDIVVQSLAHPDP
ncbi:hypothetical protein RT97_08185 [Variovorax paradoxus]|uniref:Uncharacterized protein n=1 Tax=Variovorax paradoxus TaxID=34073 RepID=A0A0D0L7C5_VARPD|nr:hypothetical protein [Variovorax paradoxus]KIQ34292.1 hypothetical protein RT97_08185 [Variovorax paradoxus]